MRIRTKELIHKRDVFEDVYKKFLNSVSRRVKEKTGILSYYLQSYVERPENLCGVILPKFELYKFMQFAVIINLYTPKKCERYVGVDINAENPPNILKYGSKQPIKKGKIVRNKDGFCISSEQLLLMRGEKFLAGIGGTANTLGNLLYTMEKLSITLSKAVETVKEK